MSELSLEAEFLNPGAGLDAPVEFSCHVPFNLAPPLLADVSYRTCLSGRMGADSSMAATNQLPGPW